MKILVVDDEPTSRLIVSEIAESLGFETVCAESASRGLEILAESEISLVLCDWEMPGMDGPTMVRELRASNHGRYVYHILVTGRNETKDLIEGLNAGADDFISKPVNPDELRVRLRSATRVIELEQSLDNRNAKLEKANARIEEALNSVTSDLTLAADMQFALLPKDKRLAGVNANWLFKPASFLAGDIFDYFLVGDAQMVFYIIDVEGHGIPSALTSFAVNNQLNPSPQGMCRRHLRATANVDTAVRRILEELNRQFARPSDDSRYFTMIFGVINLFSGQITLAQAGHPPPLHYSISENSVTAIGNGGMPVGMFESAEFETTSLQLQQGDRLYIYSDGAIECPSAQGELYSQVRLEDAVRNWAGIPIEKLSSILDKEFLDWNGTSRFEDDVSMVCLEYQTPLQLDANQGSRAAYTGVERRLSEQHAPVAVAKDRFQQH